MFHSMQYIYEVYKERSFSKAAANLYISQPSLSAAVKKVEEKIGAPIFDRSVSPIQLTECGEHYIRSVEEIMEIQHRFENYLNDLNELKTGQIAIGGEDLPDRRRHSQCDPETGPAGNCLQHLPLRHGRHLRRGHPS